MLSPKHIKIKDYNYILPDGRIVKYPLPERDLSKLLIYKHGEISEDVFTQLPEHLSTGSLMVFNNTSSSYCRIAFYRTGIQCTERKEY